jgi:hypothetical protein
VDVVADGREQLRSRGVSLAPSPSTSSSLAPWV